MTFLSGHRVSFLAVALGIALGAHAIGCSDSAGTTPTTPTLDGGAVSEAGPTADGGACAAGTGTGSVEVKVTGLPAGALGNVTVEGAASTVTATTTLSLPGGAHTVKADRVTTADPIVRTVFKPTLSASTVCAKEGATTSVEVTYAAIPSSHALWLTHGNGTGEVASIGAASLGATGTAAANTFNVGVPAAASVAFDQDGNAWVSAGSGEVRRFAAAGLGASGAKDPDITLTSPTMSAGLPGPGPIALDKEGNLWLGLVAQQKIIKITRAAYLASDATAAVELSGVALEALGAIAFDKMGNLFVGANDKLLRYDAARLGASTSAAPDRAITAIKAGPSVNTLSTPSGLAFDATGNLWVAYFGPNAVARFLPADLAGIGDVTQTPAVQITIAVTALLEEVAFDESGGLWFTYTTGKVARFAPGQLAASGDITPSTVVTATGASSSKGVAFFPAPASSPLYSALQ